MAIPSSTSKTQCPHCYTIYQITPAQLEKSKGNVRCGNCHERFKAQILAKEEVSVARQKSREHKEAASNDLFSGQRDSEKPSTSSNSAQTRVDEALVDAQLKQSGTEKQASQLNDADSSSPKRRLQANVNSTQNDSNGLTASPSSVVANDLELERRERAEESPEKERRAQRRSERSNPTFDFQIQDSELSLPDMGQTDSSTIEPSINDNGVDLEFGTQDLVDDKDNQELINEIDQLIDEQLIVAPKSSQADDIYDPLDGLDEEIEAKSSQHDFTVPASVRSIDWQEETALHLDSDEPIYDSPVRWDTDIEEDDDLFLESDSRFSRPKMGFKSIAGFLFKSFLVVGLLIAALYQVWIKQFEPVIKTPALMSGLNSVFTPALNWLEQNGIVLPRPSSLNGIALVSALSEPHPSRASTTLLRVSFLNRSSIEQSLPWLELTLTDETAKVVARRALEPTDYLFNNSTQARIGPHELKKITIELLTFPEAATGFELKMLQSPER